MTQDLGIDGYSEADLIAQHDGTSVYRCHASRFDRDVVVKVVAGNGFDPKLFEQDARALRTVSDAPNIARVLDAGLSQHGERYTAMEYAPRGSVADQMSAGVTIPSGAAMEISVKSARALASVHDAGLVHGNVSPSNVLIDMRGEPLLTDIGNTTTAGVREVSPEHAAPEVLDGQRPNSAADIYALGSTMYTILAGHEPFAGVAASREELAAWKRGHDAPPLRDFGLSPRVSDIVARCMARRPTDRYASARIVAEALVQAARPANGNGATAAATAAAATATAAVGAPVDMAVGAGTVALGAGTLPPAQRGVTFVPLGVDLDTPTTLVPSPVDTPELPPVRHRVRDDDARRRRRGRITAVIAALAVLALGGAAVAVVRNNSGKTSATAPPVSTSPPPAVHHPSTVLRHAFPTLQLGPTPGLVSQLWETSVDRRSLTATINVSNAARARLNGTLRVVIPKEVSRSLDGITFAPKYSVVISRDPKVAYRMKIPAGGSYIVHYKVHFTTPLSVAKLTALAKAEMHDLAVDAKQLGVAAPKQVAVALSIEPKSSTLVMTDAHRRPTVPLRVTETFAGVVLHDPVLWRSTTPAVADVDANGLVSAYARGHTVVGATVGSVTVHAAIAVIDNTTTTTVGTTPPPTHAPPTSGPPPPVTTTAPTVPSTTVPRPTTTTLPPTTTTAPTTTTIPPTTTTTIPITIPPLPANPDVNGDGVVGCIDVGLVNDYVGTTSAAEDIDGNGVVNSADVAADLSHYTQPDGDGTTRSDLGCPPP